MKTLSAKSDHSIDMCSGSVFQKMLLFAVPLMLSGMLQLLFNAADVMVVGKFSANGETALAAVGATTSLINLLTNMFIGLSVGANVMVARYFGAGKDRDVSDTVHTSIAVSVICGVFLTAVGILFAPTILSWMQTPADVLGSASVYLRTYFAGMTSTMVYNFGSAVLRAVGDTRRPLYFLSASGIINVALNLLFVLVFRWSVFGVGLATAISQTVSAICVVVCLMRETSAIRLELKNLRVKKEKLLKIAQIGLPAGIQGSLFSLANVVIQSSINSFGKIAVAGNTAALNLEGFVFTAMNAFHQAAISFTSQNIGAGRYDRINRIAYTALLCVMVVGVVLGGTLYLFGEPLLSLYTDSPDVIASGMDRFAIITLSFALAGMMDVMVGSLRGMGASVLPMIVSLVGVCALRLAWIATVFQLPAFHNITMLYITYPISWAVTFLAHTVCFFIVRARYK